MVFDELLLTVTDGDYGGFCQRTVHVYRTCTSHRVAWTHKQVKFVSDNLKVIFQTTRCTHRDYHSFIACAAMARSAALRFLLCALGRCFQPGVSTEQKEKIN